MLLFFKSAKLNFTIINQQMRKCGICQDLYDRIRKQPITICKNKHTVCSSCYINMENSTNPRCPVCFQSILTIRTVDKSLVDQLPELRKNQEQKYNIEIAGRSNKMLNSVDQLQPQADMGSRPPNRKKKQENCECCFTCECEMDRVRGFYWVFFFFIQLPYAIGALILGNNQGCSSPAVSWLLTTGYIDMLILVVALLLLILILQKIFSILAGERILKAFYVLLYIKVIFYFLPMLLIIEGGTCDDTTAVLFINISIWIYGGISGLGLVLIIGLIFYVCCP